LPGAIGAYTFPLGDEAEEDAGELGDCASTRDDGCVRAGDGCRPAPLRFVVSASVVTTRIDTTAATSTVRATTIHRN